MLYQARAVMELDQMVSLLVQPTIPRPSKATICEILVMAAVGQSNLVRLNLSNIYRVRVLRNTVTSDGGGTHN